jgi:hypothetical protein
VPLRLSVLILLVVEIKPAALFTTKPAVDRPETVRLESESEVNVLAFPPSEIDVPPTVIDELASCPLVIVPLRLAAGNVESVSVRAGTDAVFVREPVSAPPSVSVMPVTVPTPETNEAGITPELPVTVPVNVRLKPAGTAKEDVKEPVAVIFCTVLTLDVTGCPNETRAKAHASKNKIRTRMRRKNVFMCICNSITKSAQILFGQAQVKHCQLHLWLLNREKAKLCHSKEPHCPI